MPPELGAIGKLVDGLQLAPLGRDEAELAGGWRRDFAAQGITLSQADCLIAACAVGLGARLATGNVKDYPMPQLDGGALARRGMTEPSSLTIRRGAPNTGS